LQAALVNNAHEKAKNEVVVAAKLNQHPDFKKPRCVTPPAPLNTQPRARVLLMHTRARARAHMPLCSTKSKNALYLLFSFLSPALSLTLVV
jgi:hypothetical protein